MALDPTARLSNILDSLKKYFIDSLHTTEGKEVMFDKSLSTPDLTDKSIDRWVVINFGALDMGTLSELYLNIFICSRQDAESFKNSQLRDVVMSYLSDTTQTDGMRRISLYKSSATEAWTLIGAILVQEVTEGPLFEAEDLTKARQLTVRLRWASKI